MNQLLINTLEDCLTRLEADFPLEGCLGDCCEYREEIRELLKIAQAIRYLSIDEVPTGSIENGRYNLSTFERVGLTNKINVNAKPI